MFGEKAAEIAALKAANTQLTQKVAAVEGDPYYKIAQDIGAEAAGIVASGDNVDVRITDLVTATRTAVVGRRIQEAAATRTHEEILAAKETIDAEVSAQAETIATQNVQTWLETEGPAYRAAQAAKFEEARTKELIRAAQQQLEDEARTRRVAELAEEMREDQVSEEEREKLKERAKDMRRSTKLTKVLPCSMLTPGDELTIGFTGPGQGFLPLTMYDEYRSDQELRKMVLHCEDPASGLMTISKDSWWENGSKRDEAFRPGTQLRICALNSAREKNSQLQYIIVKGNPVYFQLVDSNMRNTIGKLEVWWVDLDEFRVLS